MNYLSVCSGIEAATVAWEGLGWKPVGFSEIEPFPSAVLEHHYPSTPNFGDMTQFKTWDINDSNISLLVGGTPCQSFSVAGLRKGLHDPRGGLMLTYLEIAQHFRPKWIVWENVPGVLSSAGGRDFGSFLGALGELGYGWAYRVLDAQWFGVAQRRRRVFVVGCLGDPTAAAKVLFESESVCRDIEKSRKARKGVAPTVTSGALFSRTGNDRVECDALVPMLSKCLTRGVMQRYDTDTETLIPQEMQVRRLTPTECERLQGFPDGYAAIPWKGKSADDCPDDPRYKALGNSMAVPVMRWIGERIHALEKPLDLFEPLTD